MSRACIPDPNGGYREITAACTRKKLKTRFHIVDRLRRGLIPYRYEQWPDGVEAKTRRIPLPLAPTSDDPNSRLLKPKESELLTGFIPPQLGDNLPQGVLDGVVIPFYDNYHLGLVV